MTSAHWGPYPPITDHMHSYHSQYSSPIPFAGQQTTNPRWLNLRSVALHFVDSHVVNQIFLGKNGVVNVTSPASSQCQVY
jgi:hypothetical protein